MSFIRRYKLLLTEGLLTLLLVAFILLVVGSSPREDVDLPRLEEAIMPQLAGAENMKSASVMKLKDIYGLLANEYADFILYIPRSNMDAQEMLLIRCRSQEQAQAAAEALSRRIQEQIGIFESYGMEQMALIRRAVVDVQGLYCLYLCDLNAQAGQQAFRDLLKAR